MSIEDKSKTTTFKPSKYAPSIGKFFVESLSKSKKIPFREIVSNACDGIRKRRALIKKQIVDNIPVDNRKPWGIKLEDIDLPESEREIIIQYPDLSEIASELVDVAIIDNGVGIRQERYDDFTSFGHLRKDTEDEEGIDGLEPSVGYFGIGKATPLALSTTKTVEFHTVSLTPQGKKFGMIATMRMEKDGTIGFDDPPEYVDSTEVLNHLGVKVVIKDIKKENLISKKALKEYLEDTMVLKITRGYKIVIIDMATWREGFSFEQLRPPAGFDGKDELLFTLDNGSKVTGNAKERDLMNQQRGKGYRGNLALSKDFVKIDVIDIPWVVDMRLNCNELRLLGTREGVVEDEVFQEMMTKIDLYLETNGYKRRVVKSAANPNTDSYYQKEAVKIMNKYFAQNPDETIPFPPGVKMVEGMQGLTKEKNKGKISYNILKKSKLVFTENPAEIRTDIVSRKNKKVRGRPKKGGIRIVKHRGRKVVVGMGEVRVKNDVEQEDQINPDIPFKRLPEGDLQNPTLYYDADEKAFIINLIRPSYRIFDNMNSKVAKHEIARAIIRATPESKTMYLAEFDKKYYKLIDSMESDE